MCWMSLRCISLIAFDCIDRYPVLDVWSTRVISLKGGHAVLAIVLFGSFS